MTAQTIAHPAGRRRSSRRALGVVRGPRVVPLVFFTFLVVAVFFAMIYLRIALDRTAFELDSLENDISLEQSRQLDLRLQIAQLQDPLRVASEAERIGLTYPAERVAIAISTVGETSMVPGGEVPVRALPGGPD